jgi:hypothetical protein
MAQDISGYPDPTIYLAVDYFSRFTTGTVLTIDAGLSLYSYRVHQHFPKQDQ